MSEPGGHAATHSDDDLLAQADRIHDEAPDRALMMLRHVGPGRLAAECLPRLAFLLNHVMGEHFGLWPEALEAQRALLAAAGRAPGPLLLRQAAVAAQAGGDAAQARTWTEALAGAAHAPPAAARALVSLAVVGFTVAREDAETAGRLALQALSPLASLHAAAGSSLDQPFAATTNNLASSLLDRPLPDLEQPDLRTAIALAAEHSQRFWQRAGTWVNAERAHYLRALAANALGEAGAAATHARAGLALLDAHDDAHAQDVDRAFLELELAHALALAGGADDAADAAQDRAEALAARFEDAALARWFDQRERRNAELAARYRRG
ncbi:MAG: hypothetical protein ACTHL8_02915 [Burkholderiaceae bacterium]